METKFNKRFILILSILFIQCYAQEGMIGLDELLLNYQKSFLGDYPSVSYVTEAKTVLSKSNSAETPVGIYNMTVYRNNDFLDASVERDFVSDGRKYLDRGIITDRSIFIQGNSDGSIEFVIITSDPQDMLDRHRGLLEYKSLGNVLDGYVRGSYRKTLPEILKEEQNLQYSITSEVLDDKSVILAVFETKYGKIKLWLDPDVGYCPRKIVLEKNEGDLHFKNVIGKEPKPRPEGVTVFFPNEVRDSVILTAYPIEIQNIGNRYFPVSATVVERTKYRSGVTSKRTCDFSQKNIDLNPDFEKLGAFKLKPDEIPNGTPVIFDDELGKFRVSYEWFDGKPRVKVGSCSLDMHTNEIAQNNTNEVHIGQKNMDQSSSTGLVSSGLVSLLFISITIVLIVCSAVAWLLYRRRA